MNQRQELIDSFGTTSWLVSRFAEGVSHEDSIATPPFRANSFNWVLGHILVSRDRVMALLGYDVVLQPHEKDLYETGSNTLNPEEAVRLETLLQAMQESQERIAQCLTAVTDEELGEMYNEERGQTVQDRIAGLHWHETYHVGQLEILRQVHREQKPFP